MNASGQVFWQRRFGGVPPTLLDGLAGACHGARNDAAKKYPRVRGAAAIASEP